MNIEKGDNIQKNTEKVICVFCGSSKLVDNKYLELAYSLGKKIAENQFTMLYGGSNSGLMNTLADGTIDAGGKSIGIFPDKVFGRFELANPNISEMINVPDLFVRKSVMIEKSDAFVVLPGGYGTIDELFEVVNLISIGVIDKPLIIVNYQGFWDKLLELIEFIEREKFTHGEKFTRGVTQKVYIVKELDECILSLKELLK